MDTLNDIISGLKFGNLDPVEAHDRVLALFSVSGSALLNDLIKEGEEVIAINGLRFTGTHEEKIKQVFDKHGIKYESPF